MEKRCRSLEEYLAYPGAPEGVSVVCGRAEELARSLEGRFELLTMRSFGPPAAAAEAEAARIAEEEAALVGVEDAVRGRVGVAGAEGRVHDLP